MKIIKKTESLCNVCLKKIPAHIILKNRKIIVEKVCPEHGKSEGDHIWEDPEIYKGASEIETSPEVSANVALALTYKCNLDCSVCYANANETDIPDLDLEDSETLKKMDEYSVIFLSGGEPTVRKDIETIIKKLKQRKKKVVIFSNGLKLAEENFASMLKKAGTRNVILQFDSPSDDENRYMRGKNLFEIKKKAIENAAASNLPIYLQSVILKDRNIKNLKKIIEFSRKHPIVKAITFNPLWRIGRYNEEDFLSCSNILIEISRILGLEKSDWIKSSKLLCNIDKIISIFKERKKIFGKCNLKCVVFWEKNECIPITKIFDVDKLNRKIDRVYKSKSRFRAILFLLYFIWDQAVLGFFLNKNFRKVVMKMINNRAFFSQKEYLLFNPLSLISVNVMPTIDNLDYDFLSQCNFRAISADDLTFEPACIHRISAMKKYEAKEK